MTKTASNGALKSVLRLIEVQALRGASDQELIQRFVANKDESAFRVIAERHGPMVLGVCRRALGCPHDAEDAFQATFLVFARSAQTIRNSESLGSWLHGIARRVSSKLVRERTRRAHREESSPPRSSADLVEELSWAEVRAGLDEELERLPRHYRDVLVCCYLEGKTRDEAAQQLGLSLGTLHGQLERARKLLAERLTARGLSLSVTGLAIAVSPSIASATVRAASLFAASQSVSGMVSPGVLSLTNEVLRGIVMTKVKLFGATCLALLVVGACVGLGLGQDKNAPEKDKPVVEKTLTFLGTKAAKQDTDEEFIRRLSLDLRGTLPTTTEVHFFAQSKEAKKREKLVDLFVQERNSRKEAESKQHKAAEMSKAFQAGLDRLAAEAAKRDAAALAEALAKERAAREEVERRRQKEAEAVHKKLAEEAARALGVEVAKAREKSREEIESLKNKVELAMLTVKEKELLLSAANHKMRSTKDAEQRAEAELKAQLLAIELARAKLALREADSTLIAAVKRAESQSEKKEQPKVEKK